MRTTAESQRQRILEHLRRESLTTHYARTVLDIPSPAPRVLELRKQGYNIVTEWETVDTGKDKHRFARYVLLGSAPTKN